MNLLPTIARCSIRVKITLIKCLDFYHFVLIAFLNFLQVVLLYFREIYCSFVCFVTDYEHINIHKILIAT